MLLLFATLAKAEGDIDVARELLMVTMLRRTAETSHYSVHVADRLGIGDDYLRLAEVQVQQMRNHDWAEQHHLDCIAAVRNEMIRRDWWD